MMSVVVKFKASHIVKNTRKTAIGHLSVNIGKHKLITTSVFLNTWMKDIFFVQKSHFGPIVSSVPWLEISIDRCRIWPITGKISQKRLK